MSMVFGVPGVSLMCLGILLCGGQPCVVHTVGEPDLIVQISFAADRASRQDVDDLLASTAIRCGDWPGEYVAVSVDSVSFNVAGSHAGTGGFVVVGVCVGEPPALLRPPPPPPPPPEHSAATTMMTIAMTPSRTARRTQYTRRPRGPTGRSTLLTHGIVGR